MFTKFISVFFSQWPIWAIAVAPVFIERLARVWKPAKAWLEINHRGFIFELMAVIASFFGAAYFVYADLQTDFQKKMDGALKELSKAKNVPIRANIIVNAGNVYHPFGGSPAEAYIEIKNIGQTRAREVGYEVWIDVKDKKTKITKCSDLNKHFPFEDTIDVEQGKYIARHFKRVWKSKEEANSVLRAEKFFYICGRVKYQDEFRKNWSESFCFRYAGPNTGQRRVPSGLAQVYPSEEHRPCPDLRRTTKTRE